MKNNVAHNDRFFLSSILDAIAEIEYHQQSKSDPKTAFRAIILELMTIGEACTKISTDLKKRYPHVDWVDIEGTRHRIVHEYFRINPTIIQNIVSHHLSDLRYQMERILKEIGQ